MSTNDPFDDFWDEESADSSPRRGRPRVRQSRDKGAVGRPRIRPLEQKYARRRGRPALNSGTIADKIEREGIISGSYGSKAVAGSFRNFDKSVTILQKSVVAPLSKSITAFSKSVSDFNRYHQQYLKDQIAFSKEFHETFKLFRKSTIDPLIRAGARGQKGTKEISKVMKEIYKNQDGKYSREYREMYNFVRELDKRLDKSVRTSVTLVEGTDTFLKEYYRTSKNTSKFLNSVSYAVEDVAEDMAALKDNMAKYFKGKNTNKSILQDQTESLKRIEKNTKQPTIGKRVVSAAIAAAVAAGKTMFRFNRYGTIELIQKMFGKSKDGMGLGAKFKEVLEDAWAVSIREKTRDSAGKLRNTFDGAYSGMYGPVAEKTAEGIRGVAKVFVSNIKGVAGGINAAWNKPQTKERWKWFFEVAKTMGVNWYNWQGTLGERQVNSVITNYGKKNYKGPHGGSSGIYSPEEMLVAQRRLWDRYQGENLNNFNDMGNLAYTVPTSPGLAGAAFWGSGAGAAAIPRGGANNVIKGPWKSKAIDPNAGYGTGPAIITLDPKSESTLTTANVNTPRKAMASLAKIQGRMLGYIEKLWKNIKGGLDSTKKKEKGDGWLGKAAGILGAGGLAAWVMKNRKLLGKGGKLAALGSMIFGGHALKRGFAGKAAGAAKWKGLRNLGATSRVLWDTFGWGNAAKGGTGALGIFKKTKLGSSALGTFIRQARLASAGYGTGIGSRLMGAAIHSNKWGGGPLGHLAGAWHGLGGRFVKEEGKLLPRIAWDARKSTGWAKSAGKAGTGSSARVIANLKEIDKLKFLAAHPQIGSKLGTGVIGKTTAKVAGAGAALWGAGKGIVGGVGKAMTKIPSKDKLLGGILKVAGGGAALKAIGKIGGKSVGKALAKQIPILGALIGIGFGIHRFTKGEIIPGILEIVSGLLTLVPTGAGNAAALAIDVGLAGYDVNKAMKKDQKADKKLKKMKKGKDTQKKVAAAAAGATGSVGAAAINKAVGSTTNHVSSAQKTADEAGGSYSGGADPRYFTDHYSKSSGLGAAINSFASTASRKMNTAGKILGAYAAGEAGGEKTTVNKDTGAIAWNGTQHDKLMPEFATKLYSAADEFYKKTGKRVNVTSAIRTNEKQAELWVRGALLKEPGIFTPAKPAMDTTITWKGKQYKVQGKGQRTRTGHMAGGAVDVSNWAEFKPYAQKYGLKWQGASDPVHFQIDKAGPVITSNVNTYKPPAASGGNAKVGDGDTTMMSTTTPVVGSSGNMGPGSPPSTTNEVSPMIQDWGLAIVNNLLFA